MMRYNNKSAELREEFLKRKSSREFEEKWMEGNRSPSLSEYLNIKLAEKKVVKRTVIEKGNLGISYAYDLFEGDKAFPSRDIVIQFAFGFEMDEEETAELLKIAGHGNLSVRVDRDRVILGCINGKMDINQTNEKLEKKGFTLLGSDK